MIEPVRGTHRFGRFYIYFFFVFLAIYLFFSAFVEKKPAKEESKSIEVFRAAENKWQESEDIAKKLDDYFKQNPEMGVIFNSVIMLVICAIGTGFLLNILFFTSPKWRLYITRAGPALQNEWPVYALFKVMVLWILFSLALSLLMGLIQRLLQQHMSMSAFAVLHTSFVDIAMVFLILFVIRRFGSRFSDVGFKLKAREILNEIKVGLLGYAAVLPYFLLSLIVLVVISNLLSYEPEPHPLVDVFLEEGPEKSPLILYSVILASFIGPFIEEKMQSYDPRLTMHTIWAVIRKANQFIEEQKPWALAKDPEKKEQLSDVLSSLLETLAHVAIVLRSFLPQTAEQILTRLKLDPEVAVHSESAFQKYLVPEGTQIERGEPLFPRLEDEA